jgi:formylglycine-generating enzyme
MSTCGAGGSGTESCATSRQVPAGTFYRDSNAVASTQTGSQASVSALRIDKYEITVGRFRQFVAAASQGWLPAAGSGKHSHLNGGRGLVDSGDPTGATYETGWDSSWNVNLATTAAAWDANLSCNSLATWTSSPGASENRPINCIDWYDAYAFCIWDDGFLPSDAEWNYAASGGSEQRVFPWSAPATSQDIDCTYANYGGGTFGGGNYCTAGGTDNVGSQSPKGDGKWGHSDLGGNVWEWVLDYASTGACVDCADTTQPPPFPSPAPPGASRVNRGGGLGAGFSLEVSTLNDSPTTDRDIEQGARCARSP